MIIRYIREKLKYSFIASIYRSFRYSIPDIVVNRFYYTLLSGCYRKAILYPFKILINIIYSRPKSIIVDTVSVCNLRCPMCSVPPDISRKSTNTKYMDLDVYKKVIDNIDGYVCDLSLVYAGEPLLHPYFEELVHYPSNNYFLTTVSNATVFKDGVMDAILKNIDYIYFSFDGFSKESYEKYRVGADYDSVVSNINNFLIKRSRIAKKPVVILTYLINAYNEHEVDMARNYWLKRGVDKFYSKAINLNIHRRSDGRTSVEFEHWLPKKSKITLYDKDHGVKFKIRNKKDYCYIWRTPVIRGDGVILLCCHDLNNSVYIGDVNNSKFSEIWESKEYRVIQDMAKRRMHKICRKCGK